LPFLGTEVQPLVGLTSVAKMAAYPEPPPREPVPESLAAQAAHRRVLLCFIRADVNVVLGGTEGFPRDHRTHSPLTPVASYAAPPPPYRPLQSAGHSGAHSGVQHPQQTPDGKVYYLNHNDRSTHWELPPDVASAAPPGGGGGAGPIRARGYYGTAGVCYCRTYEKAGSGGGGGGEDMC